MDEQSKARLDAAVRAFRDGGFVVIVDTSGEGSGVMAMAAEHCDAGAVNDLATHARGLVCIGIDRERARRLGLNLQSHHSKTPAYTVSIEAATGVTTGISAGDRARTVEVTIDDSSGPADVVSPGHLFPVVAHRAGVLGRRGAAEAAVDLAQLAGSGSGSGVYCQILAGSGDEANCGELDRLAAQLEIPLVTHSDLARHRTSTESLVREVETGPLDTRWGDFRVSVWEEILDGTQHVLLQLGESQVADGAAAPVVRVHSQCLTGDVFRSRLCDCGQQLERAFELVLAAGQGAVLYLRQEGRGIGLVAKLKAYELQDRGLDTVEANEQLGYDADGREYGIGAQVLARAGYDRLRLLTNNPRKVLGLEAAGITVEERIAIEVPALAENVRYLRAKKDKLGHLLEQL